MITASEGSDDGEDNEVPQNVINFMDGINFPVVYETVRVDRVGDTNQFVISCTETGVPLSNGEIELINEEIDPESIGVATIMSQSTYNLGITNGIDADGIRQFAERGLEDLDQELNFAIGCDMTDLATKINIKIDKIFLPDELVENDEEMFNKVRIMMAIGALTGVDGVNYTAGGVSDHVVINQKFAEVAEELNKDDFFLVRTRIVSESNLPENSVDMVESLVNFLSQFGLTLDNSCEEINSVISDYITTAVSVPNGISDLKLTAYPNPISAGEVLNIEGIGVGEQVKMYNLAGKEVPVIKTGTGIVIDQLPSGIYLLQTERKKILKVVVQ